MIMKILRLILPVLLFVLIVFSCEQDPFIFDVNCDECYYPEPDTADLILNFTINDENPYVPYQLFIGNAESGELDWTDTAYSETVYLAAAVNKDYSLKAFYKRDGIVVVSVDGDRLKTTRTSDVCDTECYIIKGGILDLRLKNE